MILDQSDCKKYANPLPNPTTDNIVPDYQVQVDAHAVFVTSPLNIQCEGISWPWMSDCELEAFYISRQHNPCSTFFEYYLEPERPETSTIAQQSPALVLVRVLTVSQTDRDIFGRLTLNNWSITSYRIVAQGGVCCNNRGLEATASLFLFYTLR